MLILKKRIESIILNIKNKKENSDILEDKKGEQNKKINYKYMKYRIFHIELYN